MFTKIVSPANAPKAALLVKMVFTPAEARLENTILPRLLEVFERVTKFWRVPELFTMPVPLIVSVRLPVAGTVMVNALAPGLKTMVFTSTLAERFTDVVLEVAKNAVDAPAVRRKTPPGQFEPVFQSLLPGLESHVALPPTGLTSRFHAWPRRTRVNGEKEPARRGAKRKPVVR